MYEMADDLYKCDFIFLKLGKDKVKSTRPSHHSSIRFPWLCRAKCRTLLFKLFCKINFERVPKGNTLKIVTLYIITVKVIMFYAKRLFANYCK